MWVSGLDRPAECEHEPLDPEKEKREEWLQPGSDPHSSGLQVTFDHKFMENLAYFAPFSYPAYLARNLLAVIDYMAHKDRRDETGEQGNTKYVAVWYRYANNYVAWKVKVPKTYHMYKDSSV